MSSKKPVPVNVNVLTSMLGHAKVTNVTADLVFASSCIHLEDFSREVLIQRVDGHDPREEGIVAVVGVAWRGYAKEDAIKNDTTQEDKEGRAKDDAIEIYTTQEDKEEDATSKESTPLLPLRTRNCRLLAKGWDHSIDVDSSQEENESEEAGVDNEKFCGRGTAATKGK